MPITRNDDVLRQSRLARLRLQSEGELPGGVLREEIDASWRRSLGHGLDCLEGDGAGIEQMRDLDLLLAGNRLLIDAATPNSNTWCASRQGGLVILGDAQANVLAIEGQTDALQLAGLRDLRPGSCWSECCAAPTPWAPPWSRAGRP